MTASCQAEQVLVLDKEAYAQGLTPETFAAFGIEILRADNEERALDILARQAPQVLVTDLQHSGIAWLTAVRERFPDLSIIVTTGFTDVNLATDTQLGRVATTILAQPYKLEHLALAIRHALLHTTVSSIMDVPSMDRKQAPCRVLIAEDDGSLGTLLSTRLRERGYDPTCVEDGAAALEAVTSQDFDILVTDIMIPYMNGLELTRKVRQFKPRMPIIVTSTRQDVEASRQALRAGAYAYVVKPLNIEELCLFMDRAILADKLERKLRDQNAILEKSTEELEKALNALRAQADLGTAGQRADIEQLSAKVAHELKSPVNSISASFYYVRSQISPEVLAANPKIARHCEIIETQIQRSREIIEDMLGLATPGPAHLREIQVNELLREVVGQVWPAEHRAEVRLELDPELPSVRASETRLKQVFSNLIINAAKAMKDGGVLTITTATDGAAKVTISFADTGPGLPSSIIHKIFDPFFTTDRSQGTGLGLSFCRETVEQFGGTIVADNAPAGGAVFTIALPRTAPEEVLAA